jgi:TPP-dependent indolepyruvate ferredoxin oxidoreductase alpha subunit
VDVYFAIADKCSYKTYEGCGDCTAEFGCEGCELDDERKDYESELIADFVCMALALKERKDAENA